MTRPHRTSLAFRTGTAIAAVALATACNRGAAATSPAADAGGSDWPAYNRTLAGDRFAPLADINRSNVSRLAEVCSYSLPVVADLQTGPVVVNGVMYFTSDTITYAVDAGTCAERWRVARHASPAVNRGVAVMDGRVFRGTSDSHVLALDAATGRTLWDVQLDVAGPGVSVPMAPIAWQGNVYIGNAGGDRVGVIGHVYALDATDGHVVWKFDVVPASGPARGTWGRGNAAAYPISGGAFWTSFTLDESAGALYVAAGNPAPDYDAAMRDGENLYANSIIALDAASGRLLGYNQVVKHDFHDWDVDAPAALVTTRSGKRIVASANKDGLLSVLDRGVIARGVGVVAASTQPPELPLLFQTPTTRRVNVDVPLSRDRKVHFCPGSLGGSEWNGAAYDRGDNLLITGAADWCSTVQLQRESTPVPRIGAAWFGNVGGFGEAMDSAEHARGWITAVDADNGAVKWKFAAPRPVLGGVTPTAGGLVFAGDLSGAFYAFDAASGRILWQTALGQSVGGGVVSYRAGGRQLVAVTAGMRSALWADASRSSRIVVFGLR
ncbi:MAG TPA: PQQ-binding-like beta-propeller repeat protein [Gemmatimonadaceae bacterium]|nr:PQQ-binding-like beta-propeller repeat protein [Gemmatimonadaceae bacterium]